jgi:hypothetical protein
MSLVSWLRKPNRSGSVERRRSQTASRKRFTFRPQLESLEDRWMPSTLTVTTAADNATNPIPGSLRYEVGIAQNGDTIVFDRSLKGQTIGLNNAQIEITQNLTIQGLGAANLAISGENASRVFQVDTSGQVTIAGLTIENGNASSADGGGILDASGDLTVSGCTLSGNTAYDGGGIESYAASTLTVSDCTISGNSAADIGGGMVTGGPQVTLSASTVTGNTAVRGAGIYNYSFLTIDKSVVCNNFDTQGLGEDDLTNIETTHSGFVLTRGSKVCVVYNFLGAS